MALHHPTAWAATAEEQLAGARTMIIAMTILGALLLGILLYQLSQQSSQAKYKEEDAKRKGGPPKKSADLSAAVARELGRLPVTPDARQEVARSVNDIIRKAIDEQVEGAKKEVSSQYDKVLEEQRRASAAVQRKYQDVLVEKKQTVSVLESIAEGLVVVNNKGEVVMMNPAAEKLLAMNQKDHIGKPLMDDIKEGQMVSMAQGSNEDREIVLNATQESTKKVLRASNAMITDEDGRTVGMVAVLSDVTKQRELDQMKSDFVSKVSHELRTPLIAMQHALSILADGVAGALSEEQKKFITLCTRNLQRLNNLINDLLDLSKLEAKKMELRVESVAIGTVITGVCESMEAWANSKAITLGKRIEESLPNVTCDPARVTQVLTNLVGNAVKFTPKQGRIIIDAQLTVDGKAIEVGVADNGVGIAKEDLAKLFNKFQQVGERTATDIGGTGLGLAISKEIVELHRGRVWAESDPVKKGARFAFTLPLEPPPSSSPEGA